MTKEKSCGILIFRTNHKREREYLILHYPSGHFDYPKGHVEENEEEKETALRELQEETGITQVEFVPEYYEVITYSFTREAMRITKDVHYFLARVRPDQDVAISHEHLDHEWLPYENALEKVTFENAKQLLRKAEKLLRIETGIIKK